MAHGGVSSNVVSVIHTASVPSTDRTVKRYLLGAALTLAATIGAAGAGMEGVPSLVQQAEPLRPTLFSAIAGGMLSMAALTVLGHVVMNRELTRLASLDRQHHAARKIATPWWDGDARTHVRRIAFWPRLAVMIGIDTLSMGVMSLVLVAAFGSQLMPLLWGGLLFLLVGWNFFQRGLPGMQASVETHLGLAPGDLTAPHGGAQAGSPADDEPHSSQRMADRLGARREPSPYPQPLLGEPIPPKLLQGAEERLAQSFPELYRRYQPLQRKYFADYLPGAAGIMAIDGELALLLERRYANLPRGISQEATDLLIYLHLVHELAELSFADPPESLSLDLTRELAALLAQAQVYYGFTVEERALLHDAVQALDVAEPDLDDRFGPVLALYDQYDATTILADTVRPELITFLQRYPGFEQQTLDAPQLETHLAQVTTLLDQTPVMPAVKIEPSATISSQPERIVEKEWQLQPRAMEELATYVDDHLLRGVVVAAPLEHFLVRSSRVGVGFDNTRRAIAAVIVIGLPPLYDETGQTWKAVAQHTPFPRHPVRDVGFLADPTGQVKKVILVIADEALSGFQSVHKRKLLTGSSSVTTNLTYEIITVSQAVERADELQGILRFVQRPVAAPGMADRLGARREPSPYPQPLLGEPIPPKLLQGAEERLAQSFP
ncbi:MAG: hypothetical protein HY596_00025, partial [Candidatus Omnitrophica bacterium]|nr:hypothetical protein [Candidatus Omnitrophota bacterium]